MTDRDASAIDERPTEYNSECVFCRIVQGEFATAFVAESPNAVAIADLAPQAPTHVLVVPRRHVVDLSETTGKEALLGELLGLARQVAHDAGLDESGYRVLTNNGPDAGQSVFHLHFHVLGGRPLGVGLA